MCVDLLNKLKVGHETTIKRVTFREAILRIQNEQEITKIEQVTSNKRSLDNNKQGEGNKQLNNDFKIDFNCNFNMDKVKRLDDSIGSNADDRLRIVGTLMTNTNMDNRDGEGDVLPEVCAAGGEK